MDLKSNPVYPLSLISDI